MKGVKEDKQRAISKSAIKERVSIYDISSETPVFCFKHITKNRNYNFDRVQKLNKYGKILLDLFSKLNQWSNLTWVELLSYPKKLGVETISYRFFNVKLSIEETNFVIRFLSEDYILRL